ncbi:osmotic avoidance abnormal protein 3 isoform X2 [Hermetia illucens]|uniref:osmotic avoidance abnormal protein 3 isoform X2 n=1 Tax=Hermetia illucens TaxID=343691 RepID=UPI0018CC2567|nr:osmotic avoidance abnormal protein 3 isoform X2 [Hermetia illucens]
MAENVRVVVRCRPMSQKELDAHCKNIVQIKDCMVSLENPNDLSTPAKSFTYDSAYGANAPTEALYNDICYSLVENVLEGYNGTIFAYGQTGCGKSHTMQGPEIVRDTTIGNDNDVVSTLTSQRGIISRSFDHIFEAISVATGVRYLALVSYLEIYNENLRDLLNPDDSSTNIQLKEIPGEGIIVQNLSTHTVHNSQECDALLRQGNKNRVVGATLMNAGSSRSHSIFTISLEQIQIQDNSNPVESNNTPGIRKGKLNLVDLAGSERQNKTGATGERLKEATKINLSLSALGNVISALVDGKTKHIPYRDSKLTRLLQDSLGGNTKTLMIACISPADYNYDETLSTLRYASRAKNIHNKPVINEDPKDTMLREYQQEIIQLKKLLESSEKGIPPNKTGPDSAEREKWLAIERSKLRAEYEKETMRLKSEHEVQQKEKEDLVRSMERLKTHYEQQLKDLSHVINNPNSNVVEINNNSIESSNGTSIVNPPLNSDSDRVIRREMIQQEALNRIEAIKNALIGGERANDAQLKERRIKRKLAAQRRLSALAQVLSRVEESSDRDLLQEHYSDIQHELKVKTDALKQCRMKVRALEREVSDLQSEFQLDRADYLETIRRLEKNLKFYQQIMDKALPILRKDGKYWDLDQIQADSFWNDDSKKWRLPEDMMHRFRLPPATASSAAVTPKRPLGGKLGPDHGQECNSDENSQGGEGPNDEENQQDIADYYFRPKRAAELMHQRKGFYNWKEFTARHSRQQSGNPASSWYAKSARKAITSSPTSPPSSAAPQSAAPYHHHSSGNNNMIGSFNSTNGIPWLPTTHKTLDNLTEELLAHGTGLKSAGTGNIQGRQNLAHSSNGLNKNVDNLQIVNVRAEKEIPMGQTQQQLLPSLRIRSTDRLILLGQQRKPRHLRALHHIRKANT